MEGGSVQVVGHEVGLHTAELREAPETASTTVAAWLRRCWLFGRGPWPAWSVPRPAFDGDGTERRSARGTRDVRWRGARIPLAAGPCPCPRPSDRGGTWTASSWILRGCPPGRRRSPRPRRTACCCGLRGVRRTAPSCRRSSNRGRRWRNRYLPRSRRRTPRRIPCVRDPRRGLQQQGPGTRLGLCPCEAMRPRLVVIHITHVIDATNLGSRMMLVTACHMAAATRGHRGSGSAASSR